MNPDWHRLKAVVLESDDWGLCAWVPDDRAHRVLSDQPAFRTEAGLRYGRSTLEHASDVQALVATLLDHRGGDALPPVWQANTVVANPEYSALEPPLFDVAELPLVAHPRQPARWERPGLWEAVQRAEADGVWWAELHGLHHLPATAWLQALRRGADDARHALEQASPISLAVEGSGEYDASEPRELRASDLRRAIEIFTALFGRAPASFCPPDYRFDDWLEAEAGALGLTTLQGKPEQAGGRLGPLRRRWRGLRFPHVSGRRFYMPPRIGFEPRGDAAAPGRQGLDAAHRAARAAWSQGRPAIVSTHRLNYAHLDDDWSHAGRAALRSLLERLCTDGAVFLVDAEVRQLVERAWSTRAIGPRGALVRHYGMPRETLRFPAPANARGAIVRGARQEGSAELKVAGGAAEARLDVGEYLLEWTFV